MSDPKKHDGDCKHKGPGTCTAESAEHCAERDAWEAGKEHGRKRRLEASEQAKKTPAKGSPDGQR